MYIFLWFKDEIIFHRAKYICYFFFKEIQSGYPFHKITPNLKTAQVFPFDKKPWMKRNKTILRQEIDLKFYFAYLNGISKYSVMRELLKEMTLSKIICKQKFMASFLGFCF